MQAYSIRNTHYKLVINNYQSYDAAANACAATTSTEFYEINENPIPKLDTAGSDLLASGHPLTPVEQKNYDALMAELDRLRASQPDCPDDINLDGVVNQADIDQWRMFRALSNGLSSWADLNQDGRTNLLDLKIIRQNLGPCPKSRAGPVERFFLPAWPGEVGHKISSSGQI